MNESNNFDDISKQISQMIINFDEDSKLDFFNAVNRAKRIGRNDSCWCSSGKKFKNCHLGRENLRLISINEARDKLSHTFKNKKYCCAVFDKNNCEMPIKNAHTVQRARVLSSIAEAGHVGSFYKNVNGYAKESDYKSGIKKEASAFYGFCSYHDTELFRDIELNEFSISLENCWSSSYRSICHEFYQKTAAKEFTEWMKDNIDGGRSIIEQFALQNQWHDQSREMLKGLKDISFIKTKYEQIKLSHNFEEIKSYVICFDQPLQIAVSASMSPFYNIYGEKIQNLGAIEVAFEQFAISTVTMNGNGAYVISHLKSHNVIGNYLNQVFSKDWAYIKNWLMKSIFAYTENIFFNLNWWSGISEESKERIFAFAMKENYTVPFTIDSLVGIEVNGEISSVTCLAQEVQNLNT